MPDSKGRYVNYDDDGININPRRLDYLRSRRKTKKNRIFISRIRFLARFIFTGLLIWGFIALLTLPQWNLGKDIFSSYPNKSLYIEGNEIVSKTQILMKLRRVFLPSLPIYLIDTKPIEKELIKLSPVKKVYIRRFAFPARLKIVIEEKIPVLSISPSPKIKPIAIFTNDSTIIGREFINPNITKKTYNVITYDDFYKWSSKHTKYLGTLSRNIENYSGEKLIHLDIRDANDVYAQIETVKIRIGELNKTVFDRIKRISSVLPQVKDLKDDIQYIDLRWDNSVYIKLKGKETHSKIES
jgi:cell division septal protein FtsQ